MGLGCGLYKITHNSLNTKYLAVKIINLNTNLLLIASCYLLFEKHFLNIAL